LHFYSFNSCVDNDNDVSFLIQKRKLARKCLTMEQRERERAEVQSGSTDAQIDIALSLSMALEDMDTHSYHSQLSSSSVDSGYSENTSLSNTSSLRVLSPS
jgi:hypothetical protein